MPRYFKPQLTPSEQMPPAAYGPNYPQSHRLHRQDRRIRGHPEVTPSGHASAHHGLSNRPYQGRTWTRLLYLESHGSK